jgi:hypothetical protein
VTHERDASAMGIVASRQCPLCGHFQVGFTTGDGVFHALRPGTVIRFPEGMDVACPDGPVEVDTLRDTPGQEEKEESTTYGVWIPSPARAHKNLRLKYGVMLREELMAEEIPAPLYQMAYVDKLTRLIENEIYVPIPVILDRFFTTPHLASGDPKQIAEALWQELKEIREPALAVEKWLVNGDSDVLLSLKSTKGAGRPPADEVSAQEDLIREQEALSLEGFLELL